MDVNDAIIAAQIRLNEVTRNDRRYCLLVKQIEENAFGWLIPWANKEVVTQGGEVLTIGGNLPFFVHRRTQRVYQYPAHHENDLTAWCRRLPDSAG